MVKGISTIKSYGCNRCNSRYSTENRARNCFNTGLPQIVKPGTMYQRGEELFAILLLLGTPQPKTHERRYLLDVFPSDSRYEFFEGTVSFDGQALHTIEWAHPKGGYIRHGEGKATRITESQLTELLKNGEFSKFHERVVSFRKK